MQVQRMDYDTPKMEVYDILEGLEDGILKTPFSNDNDDLIYAVEAEIQGNTLEVVMSDGTSFILICEVK